MSVYDHVYLGPAVRIKPDFFGSESAQLTIQFKKPGAEWEDAWDPNGGRASPTIPLSFWEAIQRAAIDDLCDVRPEEEGT